MRKWIALTLLSFGMLFSVCLQATDLLTAYCDAFSCDPTFKAAWADYLADRQNIPISRAALLPAIDFHLDASRQRITQDGITQAQIFNNIFVGVNEQQVFYNNSVNYYLRATQPLFDYTNWAKLQQAKSIVRESHANFCDAAQDLIVRVTQAYFDVMKAHADLFYLDAQRLAVAKQLRDTRERFKAGVIAETDYTESKAAYDRVVAQEIVAKYTLANRLEKLRTITSRLYCSLSGLDHHLPLITPCPDDINVWVCLASKQNYKLLAARYAALAARDNIKVQFGGHLPVVKTFGQYSYQYNSNYFGQGFLSRIKTLEAGINVDMPVYSGGAVNARTAQANYQYCQAVQQQEFTYRDVVANTRTSFLGIYSEINSILADKQTIISSEQALRATIASYQAGTRTILDVLNQQTKVYDAYRNFVTDEYDYLMQTILLKRYSGTLCLADIEKINCWLNRCTNLNHFNGLLEGEIIPHIHCP